MRAKPVTVHAWWNQETQLPLETATERFSLVPVTTEKEATIDMGKSLTSSSAFCNSFRADIDKSSELSYCFSSIPIATCSLEGNIFAF